jgi:hypothetical protein
MKMMSIRNIWELCLIFIRLDYVNRLVVNMLRVSIRRVIIVILLSWGCYNENSHNNSML